MNNADFWASVRTVIAEGFTPEGLLKLKCCNPHQNAGIEAGRKKDAYNRSEFLVE